MVIKITPSLSFILEKSEKELSPSLMISSNE
jgi:hypothetical protein